MFRKFYNQKSAARALWERQPTRWSAIQAALLALLFVACALTLPGLRSHYSMQQFLPAHHPLLESDRELRERFGLSAASAVLVTATLRDDSWLRAARIAELTAAEASARQVTGVTRVVSLATVETASASGDQLEVGSLFRLVPEKQWGARVLGDPLLSPGLISRDGRSVMLLVETAELATGDTAALIGELRSALNQALPAAEVRVGGVPAIQSDMSELLGKELRNFMALALLACMLTLAAYFRGWSNVVLPLFPIALSNALTLAAMSALGIPFTVLSTTLPIIVSVTVLAITTHTMLDCARLASLSRGERDKAKLVWQTVAALFVPNLLTAVTTGVGFAALAWTDVPLIRQYALSVSMGILLGWLSITLALPPLLYLMPTPVARNWTARRARWSLHVMRLRRPIFYGVLAASALMLLGGHRLNWSARLFDDLPEGQEARRSTEFIDRSLGGMIPLELAISDATQSAEGAAWNDPARLRALDGLLRSWRARPEVGSAIGLPDFLRVGGGELPASRAQIAETVFLYGMSSANPLASFLVPDGQATRLSIRLRDLPAEDLNQAVAAIQGEARAAFPGLNVTAGGMATTVHALNRELAREMIDGFWWSLAIISVFLCLVFRSVRWAFVSTVPNLLPPLALLATLALTGVPVKPGIILVFSIALGISFRNTVYLLARVRMLAARHAGRATLPVAQAWHQEGNPCLLSTLSLFGGFAVFLSSYFSINQIFGGYMLLSLFAGLIGDLIFLPAMLAVFPRFLRMKLKPSVTKEAPMPALPQKIAASLAILSLAASGAASARVTPPEVQKIFSEMEKRVASRDEEGSVRMVIIDASGARKERALEIRRKSEGASQKVLVRLQSPADLKGTALLSVGAKDREDQWLYLPSSKQTRRIVSTNRSSNFLDSELSFEDFGAAASGKFTHRLLKEDTVGGRRIAVIESVPAEKDSSSYGKVLTTVALDTYLVQTIHYYDRAGKLLKISTFSDYKQFGQGAAAKWRAQKISVQNAQTKRATVLTLSELALNQGIDDDEFSPNKLAE